MLKVGILLVLSMLWFYHGTFADNKNVKTVARIIDSVGKKYAPDKRTALFDLVSSENSGQIILKGKTNLPEAKRLVLDSLSILKISCRDSVIVLPEPSIGEKTWAIATISVANVRLKPDHETELVTQVLMGTPVKVLEAVEGWYRIQTPDLYIGWVDERGIALKTEAEMTNWKQSKRLIFNQIMGFALSAPEKKASPVSDLVLDDLLEMISVAKGYFQVRFPDGRTGFVRKADCLSYKEWTSRKPDVQAILSVTKQLLGVPYLWGGSSCKAVDCSGLTKTAYFSQGIILARDASQQARYGQHPEFNDIHNLEPGDLLFFGRSKQRVTHVGTYLGNGRFIHASGLVRINSIDPNDPTYYITAKKILVEVSRILNSLNTEGIVQVKDHPWYSLP
jgi:SH3-like domain-containing protein